MRNKYKLYEVDYIKGMMMYQFIAECLAKNIIEAEDNFEKCNQISIGVEYVITMVKL